LFCANGIPAKGISKTSIAKVAEESESNGSGLNPALVTDLIDKQSIAYAVKTFSKNVESALRKNGANKEATFCSLVRNWYHSEDEPGIRAITLSSKSSDRKCLVNIRDIFKADTGNYRKYLYKYTV
jgi:hypothetical protein